MSLTSVRIITTEITPLIAFYEKVIGVTATKYTDDFAELRTAIATLAIGSTRTLVFFGGTNIAIPGENRSVIIEFRVQDVDKQFEEQAAFLENYLVEPPTTMPWGNRSLLLRDPDGNLVNLFTPLTEEAKKRFES